MDPVVAENLASLLVSFPYDKRKMFGYDVYYVNNNMFAGVHGTNIFMRFPPDGIAGILKSEEGSAPFEPRAGLVMREYVSFNPRLLDDAPHFMQLLEQSFAYVSSLPPKIRKQRKKNPTL
jgi:TfoX/Sxy family transcriptional regulator of competence genes